jgi:neutral ceramidase
MNTTSNHPGIGPDSVRAPGRTALICALGCLYLSGSSPGSLAAEADRASFKVGLASRIITPAEPMWMAGYASRTKPAEGKEHDLYIKVLALEDPDGGKLVLLTSDLVGLPRELADAVAHEVQRKTGLPRERLMLTASHTHCGPVVTRLLMDMYEMPPEGMAKVAAYTDELRGWMVATIVKALEDLKPARLAIGKGLARFAVNRRQPTPKGIINGFNPDGPVNHDVPVLRVESPEGKLRAVVFGYACHNTTLSYYRWCGDYAGFAQADIEEKHPGAMALFWIGCGADANPLPRGKVEFCRKYGSTLAGAVEDVLAGRMTPVQGACAARYGLVVLPFDQLPAKEKLQADLLSKNTATHKRAARLLKVLEEGGKIDDRYRYYPVQVWRLGDELIWVALGGEVVVDYALRLKEELAGARSVWITAYANNVMAYIPSERVLKEGGYEGETSMVPYGMPTKWAPGIEEIIVGKVHALVKEVQARGASIQPPPKTRAPS